MIGVIGAMDQEISLFLKQMKLEKRVEKANLVFFQGRLKSKGVVVVKSGVGKVNAAVCAQILIDLFKADKIIFTGVAGAVSENMGIGDVVISSDLVQHDIDATSVGFMPGQIPYTNLRFYKADRKLVDLAFKAAKSLKIKAVKARVLTGDQFISSAEKIGELKRVFKGGCVEMEGAAVAQVCKINMVPFVIIRSISDLAGKNADLDFKQFAETASENSFKIASKMIEAL